MLSPTAHHGDRGLGLDRQRFPTVVKCCVAGGPWSRCSMLIAGQPLGSEGTCWLWTWENRSVTSLVSGIGVVIVPVLLSSANVGWTLRVKKFGIGQARGWHSRNSSCGRPAGQPSSRTPGRLVVSEGPCQASPGSASGAPADGSAHQRVSVQEVGATRPTTELQAIHRTFLGPASSSGRKG